MIDRVHLFKLRDAHSDAPTRDGLAEDVHAKLAPHVKTKGWELRVGVPAGIEAAKAWDLYVTIAFATSADEVAAKSVLDDALATVRDRSEVEKHWSFARR
jgi:hypothetical protein